MNKKIIFFSAQLPSKRVPIAGQKVAWSHLIQRRDDGDEIILFSFINDKESNYFNPHDYSFCKETHFYKVSVFRRIINYFRFFYYPIKISGRYNRKILYELVKLINKENISTIVFEFTSSLLFAKKVKELKKEIKVEFVEHDITFQAFERLYKNAAVFKKIFYFFEYFKMKKIELSCLADFDKIVTLNEKDKQILTENGIHNVEISFPIVDDWIYSLKRNQIEPFSVLFLGAMHRTENQEAILWFCENVFPILIKKFPKTVLYIVGSNPPDKIKDLENKNLCITGFVEDLSPYFEKVQVAVVPLKSGAGIKIKTLETIVAKIPTISTSIGLEGVPQSAYGILANNENEFLEQITYIFSSQNAI